MLSARRFDLPPRGSRIRYRYEPKGKQEWEFFALALGAPFSRFEVAMATILFAIGFPGIPEMMVLGLVVLLLFGSRLPSVMRSLGVGITEFRKGIKGEIDENGNKPIEDHSEPEVENSKHSSSHPTTTA